MKSSIFLVLLVLVPNIVFAGLFDFLMIKTFKDGIANKGQLNVKLVADIAQSNNSDINSFINKIYDSKIIKKGNSYYLDELFISSVKNPDKAYFHTDIFDLYCKSKNGDLYSWDNTNDQYNSMFVYGCEIEGKIDSAQFVYYNYRSGYNSAHSHRYYFLDSLGVKEFFGDKFKKSLHSYVDDTGKVSMKVVGGRRNMRFDIRMNLENSTNTKKEVDFSNTKIIVNDDVYDAEIFSDNAPIVNWVKYNNNIVYSAAKDKIKLNPRQAFNGTLRVEVSGLDEEKLVNSKISLSMGGQLYKNFSLKNDYDVFKEKREKINQD